jgi:hypothetical protein
MVSLMRRVMALQKKIRLKQLHNISIYPLMLNVFVSDQNMNMSIIAAYRVNEAIFTQKILADFTGRVLMYSRVPSKNSVPNRRGPAIHMKTNKIIK